MKWSILENYNQLRLVSLTYILLAYFDVNLLYSFCVISSFLYQFNCFLRANLKYYSYNEFKLSHNAAEAYRNIRLTFEKDSIDERIVQ